MKPQRALVICVILLTGCAEILHSNVIRPETLPYVLSAGSPDRVLVRQVNEVSSPKDGAVPVNNFTLGQLNERSVLDFSVIFNYTIPPGELYSVTLESSSSFNSTYRFFETFDLSQSGLSGGLIRLVESDAGYRSVVLEISNVSPGSPIQCLVVAYTVDVINDGNNFRIGRVVPGLRLLNSYYVNLPNPNPNAVVKHQVNIRAVGKIGFIQGTDYVEQGTGGLVLVDGGLGHSNGTLWLESGVGEELRFSILVYIEISSLNDI